MGVGLLARVVLGARRTTHARVWLHGHGLWRCGGFGGCGPLRGAAGLGWRTEPRTHACMHTCMRARRQVRAPQPYSMQPHAAWARCMVTVVWVGRAEGAHPPARTLTRTLLHARMLQAPRAHTHPCTPLSLSRPHPTPLMRPKTPKPHRREPAQHRLLPARRHRRGHRPSGRASMRGRHEVADKGT